MARPRIYRLFAALALIGGMGSAAPAPMQSGMPRDFLLADGARVKLENLRGKVVIVNIWATWCLPCRAELPLLNAYYRRHRAEGLIVIGIAVDPGKASGDQMVSPGIAYPQARHVYGRDLTVASVPTNYVFARSGRLEYIENQSFDARSIERLVGPLLKAR
ncbi:TlpA family protein disulfide reductase [Sphingomonas sp. GB1N7]|uniref:TlpA family protein disulfide reductase n=1 Tax=Parasphingomonas caseinilytica TaxID=3096158 RepID=UPI002FC9F935